MTHRKRLTREAEQLRKTERNGRGDEMIYLVPLPDNICEWNAFIRGPPDSPYEGRVFEMLSASGLAFARAVTNVGFGRSWKSIVVSNSSRLAIR